MANSDADLPSEATMSTKLRDVVIATHKAGNIEELTLKRVRARAEQELGLDAGFFKQDTEWKQKSDTIIKDAFDKYCGDDEPTPKPAAAKPKPKPKPKADNAKAQGVKRKAAAPAKKPKKRKKASSEEESEAELSDADSEEAPKPARRKKPAVVVDEDEEEDEAPKSASKPKKPTEDEDSDAEPLPTAKAAKVKDDMSESEMSSLIDDSPKKPKQKKAPAIKPKKEKAPAKPKATPKAKESDDPNEAEIKRLQGWLVKCGIRKIWSRDPELSKCSTAKEKISVLKTMLKDAGMDGKYSNEKAAAIKEQREFAKDLAAIQEGEKAWGNVAEVTSTGRPSRRAAAKPAPKQKVVFSDDEDEEMEDKEESADNDDDDEDMEDVEEDDDKDDDSGDDASDD